MDIFCIVLFRKQNSITILYSFIQIKVLLTSEICINKIKMFVRRFDCLFIEDGYGNLAHVEV